MRPKPTLYDVVFALIFILMILFSLTYLLLRVYAVAKYGDMPMRDCPTWVWWILK